MTVNVLRVRWLGRGGRKALRGGADNVEVAAGEREALATWWAAVDVLLHRLDGQVAGLHRSFEGLADRVARLERHDHVRTMTGWIEHATLRSKPLVSVIMATRNRSEFFERSIQSMCAQQYGNWELVVVDDGGDDDAADRI